MKTRLERTLNGIRKTLGRRVVVHIGIRNRGEFDIIGIEPVLDNEPMILDGVALQNDTINVSKSEVKIPSYIG